MMQRGWAAVLGTWLLVTGALGQASLPQAPEAPVLTTPKKNDAAPTPIQDALPPPPKIWSGGVEFGINGAEGNSQNFKMRFGANGKRATLDSIFKFDLIYSNASQNGVVSENRSLTNLGYEWLLRNSPWSVFATGQVETDEFKAFDVRLSGHLGIGYMVFKNDTAMLKGRLGIGGSQEIGGPNDELAPELDFGIDFEHKITGRQKFASSIDYYPNLVNFGDYRIQAKAAYEILIDPAWNLTLKMGILDRYDSTPQGRRPNDFEYFAVLLWKF